MLHYLGDHILMLMSMNLRDYLRLKVEIQGTSGEGSKAVKSFRWAFVLLCLLCNLTAVLSCLVCLAALLTSLAAMFACFVATLACFAACHCSACFSKQIRNVTNKQASKQAKSSIVSQGNAKWKPWNASRRCLYLVPTATYVKSCQPSPTHLYQAWSKQTNTRHHVSHFVW